MRKAIKARKPLRGPSDPRHGTIGGYGYWGCRCEKCREYMRVKNQDRRTEPVTTHGVSGYNLGCRCATCSRAKSASARKLRQKNSEWKSSRTQPTSISPAALSKLL